MRESLTTIHAANSMQTQTKVCDRTGTARDPE